MSPLPPKFDDLSFALVAKLRGHGHLCNVLTHIGSGNWRAIEQAIATILRPRVRAKQIDAVAGNIVELIVDGRGVTGPIMRSVFFDAVETETGARQANRIRRRIAGLRERMRNESRRPKKPGEEPQAATHTPEKTHPHSKTATQEDRTLTKAA